MQSGTMKLWNGASQRTRCESQIERHRSTNMTITTFPNVAQKDHKTNKEALSRQTEQEQHNRINTANSKAETTTITNQTNRRATDNGTETNKEG